MTAQAVKGDLRDLIRREGIGPVWCDGREVLRRIFVTVRDKNWKEVAPSEWDCEVDEVRGSATLKAKHLSDSVAFEWYGRLQTSKDSRHLRLQVEGQVLRDMAVCRLGLVLLHPVESMVHSRLSAMGLEAGNGFVVSRTIAPQPVVNGIPQAMTEPFVQLVIEREDFGTLELQFAGDLFELEDQRNWGDASFKTYCTPLRLGFPRTYKAGTAISHSVEVRFVPPDESRADNKRVVASRRGPHSRENFNDFRQQTRTENQPASAYGIVPKVGCVWRGAAQVASSVLSYPERGWHHLHVAASDIRDFAALRDVLERSSVTKLEIAVEAGEPPSPELLTLLSDHEERVSRLLLYGSRTSLPSKDAIDEWRRHLITSVGGAGIPLLIATRGYFVEFNRGASIETTAASGISFPLTATVHGDDAELIMGNVPTIRDVAETARSRTGLPCIAITPVALYHPSVTTPQFPVEMVLPWVTAMLIQAALARVDSVTLSEDVLGALDARGLEFIAGLIECAGTEVHGVNGKLPSAVHAAMVKSSVSDGQRVLATNLGLKSVSWPLSNHGLSEGLGDDAPHEEAVRFNSWQIELPGLSARWVDK